MAMHIVVLKILFLHDSVLLVYLIMEPCCLKTTNSKRTYTGKYCVLLCDHYVLNATLQNFCFHNKNMCSLPPANC